MDFQRVTSVPGWTKILFSPEKKNPYLYVNFQNSFKFSYQLECIFDNLLFLSPSSSFQESHRKM